ncbi:MAG: CBS domain-containing protein [Candidatus Electrothrix sp. AW2]|nr:CBS domain-containing protein [Candidatus Electrothrix gigas]MCI5134166.1 CBS domain-containing protein [Candidatus Electrothrix gigas]
MNQLQEVLVDTKLSLLDAIKVLDESALQILLVVDESNTLLGTVTDGDIRRAILRGVILETPVVNAMNTSPITLEAGAGRDVAMSLMRNNSIHCVPVVDQLFRVVGLETETRLLWRDVEETTVVIMAGGLGMRLRPLTESVPKPMLQVNGTPMLEHIMSRLAEQGFRRFCLSVNYRSEIIKDYFGDGKSRGVDITYIEEEKPLGTGGALSLLPASNISERIIVMNGDLLTTLNFRQLLDFHDDQRGVATMAVRDYSIRVPYGVVQTDGEKFVDLVEKPAHSYFVNSGIYVVNSECLKFVPDDVFFDLPDLFKLLRKRDKRVIIFPVREEWVDIGSLRDYKLVNKTNVGVGEE